MDIELLRHKTIGLVLSGGGVRGLAHVGLVNALEQYGIVPTVISGTSAGAMVGALYANGHKADDMLTFFKQTPLFKYSFFTINKPGLLDTERYFAIFKSYFPEDSFETLEHTLFVTATNLQKGRLEVFSQGPLIRPLLASAAIPPVFSPVEINNCLYADGGIMNNFPLEPLLDRCNFIIGSNVSVLKKVGKDAIRTSFQLTQRTTSLMMHAMNQDKLTKCNLLFQPPDLSSIGVLDKSSLEKAYTLGYNHALQVLENTFQAP